MQTIPTIGKLGACALGVFMATHAASAQEASSNDPYAMEDDSWISISGTVVTPNEDSFTLDYGEGIIQVEMDDWDTYGDKQEVTVETGMVDYNPLDDLGYQQIDRGDRVSVTGGFDHDFLEGRIFEAETVITLSDEATRAG